MIELERIRAGITVLVLGAIYWFALEARWSKSSGTNGFRKYPMPKLLALLFATVIPLLLYGAFANIILNHGEIWVSALLILSSVFCFYFMPATILCSPQKLISIRWFGLKKATLEWRDVISVYRNPEDNSIIVRDKYDHTIVHSTYNVGRTEFIDQINSLPYEFSRRF